MKGRKHGLHLHYLLFANRVEVQNMIKQKISYLSIKNETKELLVKF